LDRIGWNDDISLTFDLPGFKMPKIASSDRRSSQDSDSNFHFELWQLLKRDPPIPGHEIREGRVYVLQPPENAQKKFKNGQKSFVAAVFYWDSQAGAPYTVSRVPPASATLVA
jgi:hypothetical protein